MEFSSHWVASRRADLLQRGVLGRLPLVAGALESSLWLRTTLNVQPIIDWLVEGAPPATHAAGRAAAPLPPAASSIGFPLYRVGGVRAHAASRTCWAAASSGTSERDAGRGQRAPTHDFIESEQFLKSPMRVVFYEHIEVRRRLCDPDCPIDFGILPDLQAAGVTDFIALPLRFINGEVHAASFATRQAGGFRDAEIAALRRVTHAARAHRRDLWPAAQGAATSLDAYLGRADRARRCSPGRSSAATARRSAP